MRLTPEALLGHLKRRLTAPDYSCVQVEQEVWEVYNALECNHESRGGNRCDLVEGHDSFHEGGAAHNRVGWGGNDA